MGCDIHLHAEVRQGDGWVEILPLTTEEADWHEFYPEDLPLEWYGERNYAVFGALAGVRRDDVAVIAPPRGLPIDASNTTLSDYFEWRDDAHTPSWLGLDEVLAHDWDGDGTDGRAAKFLTQMHNIVIAADGAPCRIVFWFDN